MRIRVEKDEVYIRPYGTTVETLTSGTAKTITLDKGCYAVRSYSNSSNATSFARFGDISSTVSGSYVGATVGPIYFKGGTVEVRADFSNASDSYGRVMKYT